MNLNSGIGGRIWSIAGLSLGLLFFLISGLTAYRNIETLRASNESIRHTHMVLIALDDLLSATQDAETGQRGFLLTGADSYLDPYKSATTAVGDGLKTVTDLTRDNPTQQTNIVGLRRHIDAKLAELRETIDLRRTQGFQAALAVVTTDRGKIEMDAIRTQLGAMAQEELRLRQIRIEEMNAASRMAITGGVASALLGWALTIIIFMLLRRANRARVRQVWLQAGQMGLADAMRGDKSVEDLSEAILAFLSTYLGARGGAVFKGERGHFHRTAIMGVPMDADVPTIFGVKEGLLGQVAAEGRPMLIHDIPDGYLTIGSALGRDKPRHLVIVPAKADEVVNAVLELGFFDRVDSRILDLLDQASAAIGIALRSARFRSQLQDALEETQRQAGELQAQSEELRVSNEELEEQGRALKESQVRLEQQQVELEQTNSQLEEQAQTLETQRDELERAGASLQLKARELEQASQYKSDFLANMSHELRTPLNSLLILSKLLGDNPEGTLSADQVKYARTIESSGNDLLTLINDILDLSKIEAGHVEIQPETLSVQRLVGDIRQLFQPVADERRLGFDIVVAEDMPAVFESDRLRLEQILKNLLSNAFKFTERGRVQFTLSRVAGDRLALEVADTGIGISAEQQDSIFAAFHQADGTISRRYGGTGLGLSISRELARLLGGRISLKSEPGKGSQFSLTIPIAYDAATVAPRETAPPTIAQAAPAPAQPPSQMATTSWAIEDDRDMLAEGRRLLLVIEDDQSFASIVCDLSREMGFQCIVAGTAEEAVHLARKFRPSAVVLDLGLPDQSGLTVLDRLKHDDDTRHIPIHVVSASDHSQTALSLGAIGYLVKPVRRDQLAEVLTGLQAKLATRMRRVLIVEDDAVQRDAVGRLLQSGDVETVGVGTAAECLEQLRQQTYDCMVLDLSLPDASGYSLLETLSRDGTHGFPPVIVYTGRDLSADDEQRLRRYSSSIIIKGAKSPERLLDEVSLFLHQIVSELPTEQRKLIQKARHRDAALEGRRILIVEDDVRNVYSLTSVLEPRGAVVQIARNGQEAIDALDASSADSTKRIDLVLMDVMMPVMDGLTATRAIRGDARWKDLSIVMLTAKAMPDDQQRCLEAGANDYMAKPIDVDKLLSLVRVWMPR
ncbi:Signal transduction histidine kinase [Sphingobium sp. AP50]|uniref:response regulator n=1 Tax=Sphingobium sp. AP50 TaxID=1884369 RepID=UPI0008B63BC8|nr:response regulator [Sphingobium sp. AP50]SEJ03217.1 Signal transduction histidine kinase [Sphingobium sp. AP50]